MYAVSYWAQFLSAHCFHEKQRLCLGPTAHAATFRGSFDARVPTEAKSSKMSRRRRDGKRGNVGEVVAEVASGGSGGTGGSGCNGGDESISAGRNLPCARIQSALCAGVPFSPKGPSHNQGPKNTQLHNAAGPSAALP